MYVKSRATAVRANRAPNTVINSFCFIFDELVDLTFWVSSVVVPRPRPAITIEYKKAREPYFSARSRYLRPSQCPVNRNGQCRGLTQDMYTPPGRMLSHLPDGILSYPHKASTLSHSWVNMKVAKFQIAKKERRVKRFRNMSVTSRPAFAQDRASAERSAVAKLNHFNLKRKTETQKKKKDRS